MTNLTCPNCGQRIQHGVNQDIKKHAHALRELGYSFREMESILRNKGLNVSFSTLARILKEPKNQ